MRLQLRIPHSIPIGDLRSRAEQRVDHWAARHPQLALREHYVWSDEYLAQASYRGASGTLALTPTQIHIDLHLPALARPFRARIEQFVRREVQHVLSHPTAP